MGEFWQGHWDLSVCSGRGTGTSEITLVCFLQLWEALPSVQLSAQLE